ncbi:MAG: AAA family ATPase [Thiohalomonadaceae bacterium]
MSSPIIKQQQLVHKLLQQALDAADYTPDHTQLLETHISWIMLIGEYAYKIKKPLDLGFLDYSSLPQRQHFCVEEIRLNQRTAPQIYLSVMPITGTVDNPYFGGNGPILEYAVKMHRFPAGQLLNELLAKGHLTTQMIDTLAVNVAKFHDIAAVSDPDTPWGSVEATWQPMQENFDQIRPYLSQIEQQNQLEHVANWAKNEKKRHTNLLQQRRDGGHIRECHGDLHLGNIVLLDGAPCLFDGIEFSDSLRWLDTLNDSAFLMMDLQARKRNDYAWRFLNAYLEHNGDYASLPLLSWYLGYRAMVRAKVAAIRASQIDDNETQQQKLQGECASYLQLALSYTEPPRPYLVITHGLSGSGKTYYSQQLLEQFGLIRLRSDVERKRLHGLTAKSCSESELDSGIYTAKSSEQTYQQLALLAEHILTAEQPVLLDATFLQYAQRQLMRDLAQRLDLPFIIIDFHASADELRRRIIQRKHHGQDASEADLAVLAKQIVSQEPVAENEQVHCLQIDTQQDNTHDMMISQFRKLLASIFQSSATLMQ